jgi:transcriptional regulator GlxA family with amidase domain
MVEQGRHAIDVIARETGFGSRDAPRKFAVTFALTSAQLREELTELRDNIFNMWLSNR